MPQRCADMRGPTVVTNKPTEAVRRVLQTTSMGGSVPSKYRVLRSAQMAASFWLEQGRGRGGDISRLPQLFLQRCSQQWHHNLMMTDQGVARAAFLCGPAHHVRERTIVGQEVHVYRGDLRKGVAQ